MLQKLKSCFSIDEVNCGRQFEFDFVKTLLIFTMVVSHVIEIYQEMPLSPVTSVMYHLLSGVYCAPGFMICMGIGATYTKKNNPVDFLRRGIKLFLIGFLLPILRFGVIPVLLSDPIPFSEFIGIVLCVDIMHFSGLAFLLIGFLKMAKLTNPQILIVSIVMGFLATVFNYTDFDYPVPSALLNFFFLHDGRSYFPLFGWFVFPAFGLIFGDYWKHCMDKRKFYLSVSPVAFCIATAYMVSCYILQTGPTISDYHYYGMPVWDTIMCLILFVGIFGVIYLITLPLKENARRKIMRISSQLNSIYCIHYVLLGLIEFALIRLGIEWHPNAFAYILSGAALYAVSYCIALLYPHLKAFVLRLFHKEICVKS